MFKSNLKSTKLFVVTGLALLASPSSAFAHYEALSHTLMHAAAPFGLGILGVGFLCLQINKLRS